MQSLLVLIGLVGRNGVVGRTRLAWLIGSVDWNGVVGRIRLGWNGVVGRTWLAWLSNTGKRHSRGVNYANKSLCCS